MTQLFYIFVGWLLGLLSPIIVDAIKAHRLKKETAAALRIEMEDLQFRLAVTSMHLAQSYGRVNRDLLAWLNPIVSNYAGNEPNKNIKESVTRLGALESEQLEQLAKHFHKGEGIGQSLKTFQASFLDAHLADIAKMPIPLQRRIHEFRNQLSILNQEIRKTDDHVKMTFGSLSEINHQLINQDLTNKYLFIQERAKTAADRAGDIVLELASTKK